MNAPALLRTPACVTTKITELCRHLSPEHQPTYIPITTEPGCMPNNCFWNVRQKVSAEGGRIQFGWAIWEWPHIFIEAEHHAVYVPSRGAGWIDVTPNQTPPATHRLFLPDDTATYDFDKRGRGLSNVRKPYIDDPLIHELFRLKDERLAIEDRAEADIGERVVLRGAEEGPICVMSIRLGSSKINWQ